MKQSRILVSLCRRSSVEGRVAIEESKVGGPTVDESKVEQLKVDQSKVGGLPSVTTRNSHFTPVGTSSLAEQTGGAMPVETRDRTHNREASMN